MPPYTGNYTRGGDPAAMFNEALRYLEPLVQAGKAVVDADLNDMAFARIAQRRRIIEMAIGDGSPNAGFRIDQSGGTTANNFTVKGGDGTDDGAGRFFGAGFPAALKSDIEYTGAYSADMLLIHPQVTSVTALTLTDSAANWVVNEHAGKTLTPDISVPGTTFTIVSNTATVLTIGAGDLTVATSALKHYRIELSTPSGGARVDEVFIDLFLDEIDEFEDTNLVHTDLTPSQASMNRIVLRQYVRVTEGGTAPADYTDADGRNHYIYLLATINRPDADADVLTAYLTDERRVFVAGGSPLRVRESDLSPDVINVQEIQFPPNSVTDLGGGAVSIIPVRVREQDGSPAVQAFEIRFPNGTVTDEGGNIVSVEAGASGFIGQVSRLTGLPLNSASTPPTEIIIAGSNVTAQQFPDGSTTGQKVEFEVPDDYDSGALTFNITYRMSTAVANPNNVVRLQIAAEIINTATGLLDTATYPAQNVDITTPDNSTNFIRQLAFTINEGDFGAGDCFTFLVDRLGGDGADLHTGAFEVVAYDYGYLAQVANRAATQTITLFDDTDEAPTAVGTIGNFDTVEYETALDEEQKIEFAVPDNWDGSSPFSVQFVAAMSTAEASNVVELEFEAEVVDVSAGTLTTFGPQTYLLTPANTTNNFRSPVLFQIPASVIGAGDFITLKIARRGNTGVNDTHGGSLRVIGALVSTSVLPTKGFTTVSVESFYLERTNARNVSGSILTNQDDPDYAGDFELWQLMTSSAAASRADFEWQGRLTTLQSQVSRIEVPIKGSAGSQYQLKVYVESQAGTPVYDSGLVAAPTVRTVLVLLAGDLSTQPVAGEKYFVVVEATLDNTETLRVGLPYVTQE